MIITSIKTRIMLPPQDDLYKLLDDFVNDLKAKEILVVTSKVVSVHQGRCVRINNPNDVEEKLNLVKQEADKYIDLKDTPGRRRSILTIKNNILISQSGIDCSNGNGYYILWPEQVSAVAKEIYDYLKKRFGVEKLGVVITDTRSNPWRLGSLGFSLAHFGFQALNYYHGRKDLFAREFKAQRANVVDSLAAAAVVAMGEGSEQTPLAKISDVDFIEFKEVGESPVASQAEDYYTGLIRNDLWQSDR